MLFTVFSNFFFLTSTLFFLLRRAARQAGGGAYFYLDLNTGSGLRKSIISDRDLFINVIQDPDLRLA
ncbi:hypothetical protein EO95_02600 [Methanosarcina sp. 1.H.T.1A.1]|nr:hypothetical protein EO95_02600 [Methanosarcina sp. 1.H.T.1A.1]